MAEEAGAAPSAWNAAEAQADDRVASHQSLNADIETRVRRKIDTHVLLLLCFLCKCV